MLGQWTMNQTQIEKKTRLCRKLCWWFLLASFNLCHQYDLLQALLKVDHDLNPQEKPGISDRMAADKIDEHKLAVWLLVAKNGFISKSILVVQDGNGRTKSFYCTYRSCLNDQIARWLRTSPENAGSRWELRIVRSMQFQSQHIERNMTWSALWH